MNYIVNPLWFYLISVAEGVDIATCVACVITLIVWCFSPLFFDFFCDEIDDSDKKTIKSIFKKSVILLITSLIITIMVPGRKDMEKMLIASYATEENVSAATNYGKDLVDYIFDKVNGVNKEEEKK